MPVTPGVRFPRVWHFVYLSCIVVLGILLYARRPQPRQDMAAEFQTALIRRTDNYSNVHWMGQPIWQPVLDLWTLQETIVEVKPALLIECGTYKGGSSLFFAHLFDLMGRGKVITVDIEKLHNLSHPRVTYLIGDCAAPEIVRQIQAEADKAGGPVMVVLDSDHSKAHVTKELNAYSGMVTPGSYIHVQDGVNDVLPMYEKFRPGPLAAVEAFTPKHPEFVIDSARSTRFIITHHPKGWLQRKATTASGPAERPQ